MLPKYTQSTYKHNIFLLAYSILQQLFQDGPTIPIIHITKKLNIWGAYIWRSCQFCRHMLSGRWVRNWGIQSHLCSTYRGLWALTAQASQDQALGSTPTFFSSQNIFIPSWGKVLFLG